MSNWIFFPGDTPFADRYLKAEFEVVNKILNENPTDDTIEWSGEMDMMVSDILLRDSKAPVEAKIEALYRDIKARTALLLDNYCE